MMLIDLMNTYVSVLRSFILPFMGKGVLKLNVKVIKKHVIRGENECQELVCLSGHR